jgi:hypothetical protein
MPAKAPVRKITRVDWKPMNWICLRIQDPFNGGVIIQKRAFKRKRPMRPMLRRLSREKAPNFRKTSMMVLLWPRLIGMSKGKYPILRRVGSARADGAFSETCPSYGNDTKRLNVRDRFLKIDSNRTKKEGRDPMDSRSKEILIQSWPHRCPYCDEVISYDAYSLDEGENRIVCPSCEKAFIKIVSDTAGEEEG